MVAEVASSQQVHHEVKVLSVLEGVVHVHEKRVMLELRENSAFAHDRLDAPLRQNPRFAHFLHCKHFWVLGSLVLDLPDLAEAAASDGILVLEQRLVEGADRAALFFGFQIAVAHVLYEEVRVV